MSIYNEPRQSINGGRLQERTSSSRLSRPLRAWPPAPPRAEPLLAEPPLPPLHELKFNALIPMRLPLVEQLASPPSAWPPLPDEA